MMLGYILYGDGPKRPELGERQLPGGAFVTLRMGQAAHPTGPLALSRARQGARRLREAGVPVPELLAVDRAGLVGADGETHHGCFDALYLSEIPGFTVLCPSSFAGACGRF